MVFDDNDMLGSMGLDSPQLGGRKSTLLLPDSPPETGAQSVMDSLLHGAKSQKRMPQSEKPADVMSSSLKTPGNLNFFQLIIRFISSVIN